ncbi:MAG: nucleotide exchange factor GrpE [Tannerella sp.]|jgi:molecular chaperone GrpE|nr:nucleotide exchange factor GrpE [Tannerella sp.]
MMNREREKVHPEENPNRVNEEQEQTNLQEASEKKSENSVQSDNMSDDVIAEEKENEKNAGEDFLEDDSSSRNEEDQLWEEKYAALNDSHLRLMAEYDNYRKRTLREKADLIKSGGAAVLENLLPVIDDFERALGTLQTTEDLPSAVEGVKLIYNKFVSYLSQQGVKVIEAVGQPFDTEQFEAIAAIPATEEDMKGKVIDCVQTGYMLYDKVLRHAKVVVGE